MGETSFCPVGRQERRAWKTTKEGGEGKKLKGQRRSEKRRVKGQRKTKTGGKPGGISDFHCAVPADSSWECASESPHAHTEAAVSQLMGSDGFCPRLTCTVS